MRIAIGQIVHETNTYSKVKAEKKHFQMWEWEINERVIEKHAGVEDYLGGMIAEAKRKGAEVVPTFSAFTRPSGVIERETYIEMKQLFLQKIEDAGRIDAVCLNLHGAGVAETEEDIEGDLLFALRQRIGYEIPVIITLDLHANITQKMVDNADMLIGVKEYPHVDSFEIGIKAMRCTVQMVKKQIRPTMHFLKLPLVIPLTSSFESPVKEINEMCRQLEKNPDVLDCSFFHGFPYADIHDVGCSVIAISNNSPDLAEKAAEQISKKVYDAKEKFFPKFPSPEEGVKIALETEGHPVVINEASDNPGGGAAGDGTYLLSAMIRAEVNNACFASICDPEVVNIAHATGVGKTIDIELGGKTDDRHGLPIRTRAYIKSLTDGQFVQSSPMWRGMKVDMGKSVRLQIDGVDVIVCTARSQIFDDQLFRLHGIDISEYKIVGVKSSHHFKAFYEQVCAKIITVNAPGISSSNLRDFKYENVRSGLYPLNRF